MKTETRQNNKMLKAAIIGPALIVLAIGFIFAGKDMIFPNITKVKIFNEKITGLPQDGLAKIQYITPETILNEEIKVTERGQEETGLKENEIDTALGRADKYNIHYTLQMPNMKYIDADIFINKASQIVNIKIAGMQKQDVMSIKIGGYTYFDGIPADWAGRIEFNTTPELELSNETICMVLLSDQGTEPVNICHHIPLMLKKEELS